MLRFFKKLLALVLILVILCGFLIGGAYTYVRIKMKEYDLPYTETVERILANMVPDEGITINGRNYDYYSVINFLDEIRWDPYNYIHKTHHCPLQYATESQIKLIVDSLRFVMACG